MTTYSRTTSSAVAAASTAARSDRSSSAAFAPPSFTILALATTTQRVRSPLLPRCLRHALLRLSQMVALFEGSDFVP